MVRAIARDPLHVDLLPAVLVDRRDRIVLRVRPAAPIEDVLAGEDDEQRVRCGIGDASECLDIHRPGRHGLAFAPLDKGVRRRDHNDVRTSLADHAGDRVVIGEVERDTTGHGIAVEGHDDIAPRERKTQMRPDEPARAKKQPSAVCARPVRRVSRLRTEPRRTCAGPGAGGGRACATGRAPGSRGRGTRHR